MSSENPKSTAVTSNPPTDPSQAAAARDYVARFAEHWARLNPDALDAMMHEDTQNLIPPMKAPANRAGVVEHFRQLLRAMPDIRLEPVRWASAGDAVFIEWVGQATVGGRMLHWRGVDRVRLREGRTYEAEAFWDTRRLAEMIAEAQAAAGKAPASGI